MSRLRAVEKGISVCGNISNLTLQGKIITVAKSKMPTPEVQSFVSRQEFDQHEKHTESFQAATFPGTFK